MTKKSKTIDALIKQQQREQLKAFRHAISVLKKSGIVSKKVDARSLSPTPHYKKLINEYRDVVSGKVKAVKAPAYCPTTGCKSVKRNGKKILLVDVSDKKQPKIRITKQGISIIDKAFGKSSMEVIISKKATQLLELDDNDIDKLEFDHTLTNNQFYVFTIEDKKHNKSYMSKMSFKSLDKLLSYMTAYQTGSGGEDFNNAVVTIRIMGDSDIENYQQKQKNETIANKRARKAAYAKAARLARKSKSTRNMV